MCLPAATQSAIPGHALEGWAAAGTRPLIVVVLSGCAWPQVGAPVIQPVMVDVVNALNAEDEVVHQDVAVACRCIRSVDASGPRVLEDVPAIWADQFVVFVINDSDAACGFLAVQGYGSHVTPLARCGHAPGPFAWSPGPFRTFYRH